MSGGGAEAANAGSLRVRIGTRISYDSTRLQTMAPAMVTVTDSSSLRRGRSPPGSWW